MFRAGRRFRSAKMERLFTQRRARRAARGTRVLLLMAFVQQILLMSLEEEAGQPTPLRPSLAACWQRASLDCCGVVECSSVRQRWLTVSLRVPLNERQARRRWRLGLKSWPTSSARNS